MTKQWGIVDWLRQNVLLAHGDQAGHVSDMACSQCGTIGRALTFANRERAGVILDCRKCGEQSLHAMDEE